MSTGQDKYAKQRATTSSISVVVGISLVLVVLGVLGFLWLNMKKLSDHVKEDFVMMVILKENVKEVDCIQLQKSLDAEQFVKSTEFISKEKAAENLMTTIDEDFIEFIGYNPLHASIDVRFNAEYVQGDSLAWIAAQLETNKKVHEVAYPPDLIKNVTDNMETISFYGLLFSGLLMLIAIALINNTIRLAIYSKRFLIKSMQLVGATAGFIRRPFVSKGILQGILAGMIAIGFLSGLFYLLQTQVPELIEISNLQTIGILFAFVLTLGVLISWISTHLAVRKYIRLKSDDLYKR